MTRSLLTTILLLCLTAIAVATPSDWVKLYSYGEWNALRHLSENGMLTAEWQTLWSALAAVDTTHAVPLYRKTISQDKTGTADKIAIRRLQQLTELVGTTKRTVLANSAEANGDTSSPTVSKVARALPPSPPRSIHVPDTSVKELPVVSTDQVSVLSVEARSNDEDATPQATVKLETKALPKQDSVSRSLANNPVGKYAAQFGVYSVRASAEKISQRLRDAGFDAEICEWQTGGRKLYRVVCGRFMMQKEAAARVAAVREKVDLDGIATRIE